MGNELEHHHFRLTGGELEAPEPAPGRRKGLLNCNEDFLSLFSAALPALLPLLGLPGLQP